MFSFIKKLFGFGPAPEAAPVVDSKVEAVNAAPVKVETSAPAAIKATKPAKKPAAKKQGAKKATAPKKPRPPKAKASVAK